MPLTGIPLLLPLLMLSYTLWYGLRETFGLQRRMLGLLWQVPASWVKGRPAALQALTWGTLLGPGLVTKNPYAGMWLLPLLIVLSRGGGGGSGGLPMAIAVGMVVGATHGGARALGVLRNRKSIAGDACAHQKILHARLRWQYIDGLTLLLAAGALAAYTLSLLAVHF